MIVSELQYFPPITFFTTSYPATHVYFDVYESYRKMSFRNRCFIAGAGGPISLSIPLQLGRNQRLPMHEVVIAVGEDWQARHFKSIRSAYARSPFFEYYQDGLSDLFQTPAEGLARWNLLCLKWIAEKLNWPAEFQFTERAVTGAEDRTLNQKDRVLPKNYKNWNPVQYRQVFEERTGFLPNLSILDLLFNTGNEAAGWLRGRL